MRKPVKTRAMTLVELLVVVTIVLVFSSSALAAFFQILRVSRQTDLRREAFVSLRTALDDMASEIKSAPITTFNGNNLELTYGNNIDDDDDEKGKKEAGIPEFRLHKTTNHKKTYDRGNKVKQKGYNSVYAYQGKDYGD